MIKTRLQLLLYRGHPFKNGEELTYASYNRAVIENITVAIYNNVCWGLVNNEEVEFPVSSEDWEGVTHIAIAGVDVPMILSCDTMNSETHFFDSVVSGLDMKEGIIITAGQKIVYPPNTIFLYGGLFPTYGEPIPSYMM